MSEVVRKIGSQQRHVSAAEFEAFTEKSPTNIMYANRDMEIVYANPQSIETLKKIEDHLPIRVDQVVGSSIDVFHKNPAHQRGILNNDRNLPHRAVIDVGPEKLDLLVSAIYDTKGEYCGAMVTWDVVTKKLEVEAAMARISNMMENAPVNVMYCDRDFNIVYVNPKSVETLKTLEKYLPITVDRLLGSSIDIFHKDPSHQRKILSDDRNLPHRAVIGVGPEKLDLLASPIYDQNRSFIGIMVTWDVVTKKLQSDLELARIKSIVENAPVNVLLADLDFKLIYMNPASRNTLRTLEKHLPKPVDQLVGQSIDIFHKNPSHQRGMVGTDSKLPHNAKIKVGDEVLDLLVSPIYDADQKYLGPMVTWSVITDKVTLVQNISEAADQLAAASNELNATATQMASNSEETTGQATQASSSSEEVAKGVETVATNTEEMQASIKEIARNANEASGMSNETKTQAQETNTNIQKLGESSQEIGNVIKVISSIAQQTNLLALNATIEAARAGDAGRGFAVVANEVKELAKQTATATEEITQKISAIQGDSELAVKAIGDIGQSIEKLNDIAGSIAASVEEQLATTTEVSRVVQEANTGVQGISENVKAVSAAANETSTGANQLLEAARGLQGLADRLQELVKQIEV